MQLKKILSFCLIAVQSVLWAQNSTISGTVVDATNLKPISEATVELDGYSPEKSNSLGNFQIWNVPYGTYLLKVSKDGFPLFQQNVELSDAYKYIRVRLGEKNVTTTNTTTTATTPETIVVRDTIYIVETAEVENVADAVVDAPSNSTEVAEATETKTEDKDFTPLVIDLDEVEDGSDEEAGENISSALGASRDPFYNAAAFTLGAYRYRLRGLDNANNKLYFNHIEMNDLDIGRPMWSQWGGLNDVLRNRTSVYGLDNGDFAFGGLNGSTNIDLRASKQRKQFKVSYAFSNRSYAHRAMLTYSTGMLKGGWAFSVSGSYRFAGTDAISNKIRFNQFGTNYNAYSYFAGIDKQFGKAHLLSLNIFGARNKRMRNAPATQEIMDIAGSNYYNPNWGWQTEPDGKKYIRNAKVGEVHIPTAILTHEWTFKGNASLTTSAALRKGINGSTALDWRNATDPRPDYYRNMPSYALIANGQESANNVRDFLTNNESARQINWDKLYEANYLAKEMVNGVNGTTDTGEYNIARYVVSGRRYDPTMINASINFKKDFNDKVKFNVGANYADQRTHNYQKLEDLLGAEYYIDLNNFAERDFTEDSVAQNDLSRPNRLLKQGDKYGYDYVYNTRKGGLWAQTELRFKHFDIFIANQFSISSMWRKGNVRNGLFPTNSLGDSEKKNFANFGVKGGVTYKINGRNYIFANGSYGTRAPYIRNAMLSPRTRNDFVANLKSETLYSGELGYLLKAPKLKIRATAYYAEIKDRTTNRSAYYDNKRTFGTWAMTGVNTRNFGIEAAATIEAFAGFTITPLVAWGDHTYTSRPTVTLVEDNSNKAVFENKTVYFKGLHVANGPQAAYSIGLGYRTSSYWFFNLDFNYFDKIYIDPTPARRIDEAIDNVQKDSELWVSILSQEKMKGQFVMNASIGKSWLLNKTFKKMKGKRQYLNFNLNVGNLTHNTKFATGGFEQSRFDYTNKDVSKFQNKYFYAYGLNFFAQVSYRF